jgi:hypothetical protein
MEEGRKKEKEKDERDANFGRATRRERTSLGNTDSINVVAFFFASSEGTRMIRPREERI